MNAESNSEQETYAKQIIDTVKKLELANTDKINLSKVQKELNWDKEKTTEVLKIFSVKKFSDVLKSISELEIYNLDEQTSPLYVKTRNSSAPSQTPTSNQAPTKTQNLQTRIEKLLKYINSGLKEKEEAVRLALLASIAGESIFFLGPPGTAKSMVSRRLKNAFTGKDGKELTYFEYLMNQFSTPDEVFGPVSLKSLENDEYKRITDNFLPAADVAFLDEIWKASPAIQNTLLTVINEKKFHNGKEVMNVPLKALISASNELPAENQGLEALWDRFLLRLIVNPITNEESFLDLICGKNVKAELTPTEDMAKNLISIDELSEWKDKIEKIEVSEDVRSVITAIRQEMAVRNNNKKRDEKEKFYVSDRRWKKIVNLLKTSAFLNNRSEVDLMDCQLIEYCIWNTQNQIEEAKEIVKMCIEENGLEVDTAIDDVNEQIKEFDKTVTELFYVAAPDKPSQKKMQNGKMAYELKERNTIRSYSTIGVKYITSESYYDSYGQIINGYNCKPENVKCRNGKISWTDSYYNGDYTAELRMIQSNELIQNTDVFNSQIHYEICKKTADEEYSKNSSFIDKEIKNIDFYIAKKSAPYKSNLFADQKMCDVILTAVEKSRLELEKAKSELDKVRERYSKDDRTESYAE